MSKTIEELEKEIEELKELLKIALPEGAGEPNE